jgi:hypothetical protein
MPAVWRAELSDRAWVVPKKGLSGDDNTGFREFWIKRFFCKSTGRTVSVHPRFSHFFKRFVIAFVIRCLVEILERGRSVYSETKRSGVSGRTLRRWRNGFAGAAAAKYACFAPRLDSGTTMSGLSPPRGSMPDFLFGYFRQAGNGDMVRGAVTGMVRLWERFSQPLY